MTPPLLRLRGASTVEGYSTGRSYPIVRFIDRFLCSALPLFITCEVCTLPLPSQDRVELPLSFARYCCHEGILYAIAVSTCSTIAYQTQPYWPAL